MRRTHIPSYINISIPMKSISYNICPVFRLAFLSSLLKSVENPREKYPLLPVFVHAWWGKNNRKLETE